MDIDELTKHIRKARNSDLISIMRPIGEINHIIHCNFKDFFNLKNESIQNLYETVNNTLRFNHESDLTISKCEIPLKDFLEFKAEFSSHHFIESGINYLGRIHIKNPEGRESIIRIFGEGSYDPGSSEKYLSKHDYIIASGFIVTALYSAKRGVPRNFIRKIFKIAESHPAIIRHKLMMGFMEKQIEEACYDYVNSGNYSDYLRRWAQINYRLMIKKEFEDLLTFVFVIEKVACGKRDEEHIFPCKSYLRNLIDNRRDVDNQIITYAMENEKVFIKPDIEYVKNLCRLEECIDMRILEEEADKNDKEYKSAIAEALENRNEIINDDRTENNEPDDERNASNKSILQLADPYYNCEIY
ncbi:hypothetical protein SteCoe_22270 [Stentor coeruleus]|uniref:Uncharacterized protein n=1 Tax=Stentor coeruleus TaxID=5963 RepID=A0A1R2BMK9_9CILI|nr:hypothetical protein SteCoe_22270 [Stentor coeruleus]